MHANNKNTNKNNKKRSLVWGGDEKVTVFGRAMIRKVIIIPTKPRHRIVFFMR